MNSRSPLSKYTRWVLGFGMAAALSVTGCQVDVGGQTLPSPHYMDDDIQYFPAGSEFKLSREAAAMQKAKAERELEQIGAR